MKNFLIFEDSWTRVSSQLQSDGRFQPVLFRRDGSMSLHDEAAKPIRFCKSDAQGPAIAEYVLASILARLHRFDLRADRQRARAWQLHEFRELGSCNCLLVGYGAIGSLIARQLAGFGSRLTVVRRAQGDLPNVHRVGTLQDLPRFLPEADLSQLC